MTPIAYFFDVWQRCAELGTLHNYLAKNLTPAMSADELLRAEWVARVSALDLYVHELVAENMVKILDGTRTSCPGFSKFHCSSDTLLRIKNAATPADASAAFDLEVRSKLSRVTYQFPEDIADGVRLISGSELWNEIALAKGATSATKDALAKSLKKDLSLIVERRNKIAHEGDLQRSIPRTPWPITSADVSYVAGFIEDLVRTIDAIV
jgi:RiboL-PSP-HEPN